MNSLKPSAQRVQDAIRALGFPYTVVELPDSTRTAAEAAEAIGCKVVQIAKSLVFRCQNSGAPLLVIASGVNRVNESRVAEWLQEPLEKPDANFVREHTGFVIGGVPPIGHPARLKTLIDEDLFQYDVIWAAAGHPKAVFQLTPQALVEMTNGHVLSVK
ncbi:YbaK/EbsC family protein [Alicyclobacillus shizuokensis]|uniref:YbaK/EbsC family protein n=1 Tax=Alicyclobacillus shizuokensis TaxID=392014 RepID=UPI00082F23CA|nr:YbaK/EbsC family protein [Alicyclobacillus shizuokensis]MCL6626562.1 YbaK/EbsC family protein [Alicyclobacillus shizuokensis]